MTNSTKLAIQTFCGQLLLIVWIGTTANPTFASPLQTDPPRSSWKFFRGENFDGHSLETGILDSWPETGPPVLWMRELGVGYSAFVGEGERVYTQYQSLTGQYVICLNARNGETIWERKIEWPYQPASLYPGPRSSPTISGNRIFYTTPTGTVGCLDLETGESVWSVNAFEKFAAPEVDFGYSCSPVCVEGKVILPIGGQDASMVAFDEADGTVIWNSGNDNISYCSALPIHLQGQRLVVGYFKNKLCLFDLDTGTQLASVDISFDYDEHSAWPVYREPHLWTSGPFRAGSQMFELSMDSENVDVKNVDVKNVDVKNVDVKNVDVKRVYKTDTMSNDVASSVLVGDQLYGFDIRDVQSKVHRPSRGQFICMDFVSGTTRWSNGTLGRRVLSEGEFVTRGSNRDTEGVGHSSVIYADGKLILFNDTGELILCRAQPDSFVQLGRTRVLGGEISWVPPALMNRSLFVRNHSKAACIYLGDIAELNIRDQDVKFTADFPQAEYIDWSAWILGTEPTYAMTAPKAAWLFRWYWLSMILGWGLAPVLAICLSKLVRLRPRFLYLLFSFIFGLVGTTFFGHWLEEFYFSWPIALFIAFELVVCQLKSGKSESVKRPILARISLIAFAMICVGYFLLCRRLSLAFEWTFLMGFPAALPLLWMVKRSVERDRPFGLFAWLFSVLAFTTFYWTGAGIMLWKYGG